MDDVMLWVVVLGLGAAVGAVVGTSKHRVLAGAIWGALLGPVGWLIVAVGPDAAERRAKRCPHCVGLMPVGQGECAHCNRRVVWVRGEPRKPAGRRNQSATDGCGKQAVDALAGGFGGSAILRDHLALMRG